MIMKMDGIIQNSVFHLDLHFFFLGNDIESLQQIGEGSLMAGVPSSGVQLFNGLMPVGFDLADRGLAGQEPSFIHYQTSGTPGERVFTIEWLNAVSMMKFLSLTHCLLALSIFKFAFMKMIIHLNLDMDL